ncbi:MAG TPA: hypothetical protein VE987_13600 [Polyangiaceae bacterium]|nr:hypothetical protein [Polyangiaceae bacterium]
MMRPFFAAAALGGVVSCSSSSFSGPPPNVAGDYSVDVTDGSNGCQFANWTQGSTATGIPVTVTQNATSVGVTVDGLVGSLLKLGIGTNVFTGSLSGDRATMTAAGSVAGTQGNCAYTTNATIDATFNGDTMQGTLTYTRMTNGNPDCAGITGCQTIQQFSGARPPSSE